MRSARKAPALNFFPPIRTWDLDRMLSLCDVNGTISFVPLGDPFKGKIHKVGKGLWSAIMESFPNLDNTVKSQQFDEATDTVTCKVVIFGTQEKNLPACQAKEKILIANIFLFFGLTRQEKLRISKSAGIMRDLWGS
jgi:hypothetical protein